MPVHGSTLTNWNKCSAREPSYRAKGIASHAFTRTSFASFSRVSLAAVCSLQNSTLLEFIANKRSFFELKSYNVKDIKRDSYSTPICTHTHLLVVIICLNSEFSIRGCPEFLIATEHQRSRNIYYTKNKYTTELDMFCGAYSIVIWAVQIFNKMQQLQA